MSSSGHRPLNLTRLALVPVAGAALLSMGLLAAPGLVGCGPKEAGGFGDDGVTGPDGGDDSSSSVSFPNANPIALNLGDGGGASASDDSQCKGGFYEGSFGGLYSSHLTLIGINIPVVGDVQLTLEQQGSGQQTCTLEGEATKCSDVFSVQNGVIKGTADGLFPYFCTLTGTLGCKERKLVNGWIDCTYCVGPLNDGGMSCAILGSGNGGAGAIDGGGSGPPAFGTVPPPLGANPSDYDPGAWNGAESLAGYTGMGPLPDGGTLGDYLSDAGYGKIGAMNDFGGYGWWYATYQHP